MEYTRRLYNDFIDVKDEQSIATMKKRCGYFNDSVITKIIYTSGSSRSDQNSLHPFDDLAELKVTIESQINQGMKIILIFENIIQFNLSPANINIDFIMSQPFIMMVFKDFFQSSILRKRLTKILQRKTPG
ncbi:MAG TPA: hypothetical protein PLP48_03975 [Acholeplasmataceae bacterium]|nr:hypothetical protein [Acholeplasmataceae bacterium]